MSKSKNAEISDSNSEPIQILMDAWHSKAPLYEKVRAVSTSFYKARIEFDSAIRLLQCSPAELQSVLYLATLEDEELSEISSLDPPCTTWYLFGTAENDALKAGIEGLKCKRPDQSSFMAVYEGILNVKGPDMRDRLKIIPVDLLWHLASKSKKFDVLTGKDRNFLGSIAKQRGTGKELSDGQIKWLHSILKNLVELGVVCTDSKDNDQEQCDYILEILASE